MSKLLPSPKEQIVSLAERCIWTVSVHSVYFSVFAVELSAAVVDVTEHRTIRSKQFSIAQEMMAVYMHGMVIELSLKTILIHQ